MKSSNLQLFLVRHAHYCTDNPANRDPELSIHGIRQSVELANTLEKFIQADLTIWTSPAKRAYQTAEIIKNNLSSVYEFKVCEKLWSDRDHDCHPFWLSNQVDKFKAEKGEKNASLLIVTHLEYVNYLPIAMGFPQLESHYAEAFLIHNKACIKIHPLIVGNKRSWDFLGSFFTGKVIFDIFLLCFFL